MRTITISGLLLIGLGSCSGSAQSLTENGNRELGSGDYKAALSDFEKALDKLGTDTQSNEYLQAALGRCQALARTDPKKAATEFIALAQAQKGRVLESDFTLIADALLKANTNESRKQAIEVMVAGTKLFPTSTKLKDIGNKIYAEAQKAGDPESMKSLQGLGYAGK